MLSLILLSSAFASDPKPPRAVVAGGDPPRMSVSTRLKPMGEAGVRRGMQRLSAGQYALAIDRFRAELESDPELVAARRGLALGLAGQRHCDEAVPLLEELRAEAVWDVDLAVAEGNCALRAADGSRAAAAFEEAVLLDPNDADAWYGLTQAHSVNDDWEQFDASIDGLRDAAWMAPRATLMAANAEAWAWRRFGGDEAWDALASLWDVIHASPGQARAGRVDAYNIEGELWLDLGDPIAAEAAFGHGAASALRAPRIGAWRAEAYRRLGLPEAAETLLVEGRAKRGEHLAKDIAFARLRVDQARLDEADELLSALPPNNLEVVATRWYLARARGDADAMAAAEARWRSAGPALGAELTQLIPW